MILQNYYYQLACIFILGLIFGSFYNVLIIRTISKESIIYPPSKCPKCQTQLKWYHNIPILSYTFLSGKCSYCKEKIDIMYPIVELTTAILFLISFIKFGISLKTPLSMLTLSFFLILTGMDIKTKTISNKYSYLLIIFAILFNYTNIFNSILGGLIAASSILLIKKLSETVFKQEAIGEGDIYAFAGLGCFTGLQYIIYFEIIALLLQAIISLPLYLTNKTNKILSLWFILSYLSAILLKINSIHTATLIEILIFINVIISSLILCKHLIKQIRNPENINRVPFLPAILLSAILFVLLI